VGWTRSVPLAARLLLARTPSSSSLTTVAALADNEKYLVEITFPCALTSAVALTNFEFTYA